MRKVVLILMLFSGIFSVKIAGAQLKVNVNVNIGNQPQWGPVGYDHVDYYYMPDIDVYYYVPRRQYVYLDGGRWVFAASLPGRYGSYDLYRGYKVVVNEPAPYRRCEVYRERYKRYRGCHGQQVVLRDRPYRRDYDDRDDQDGRDDDRRRHHGRGHAYGHDKHDD